ncbi:MAG: hypothetical protein E7333_05625 [Clostridiales bacterium]|nr:hypothetical protein [Clostridiales bacterium]
MAARAWQSLNFIQVFDVLREQTVCRMAVTEADGQPWCVPMEYQMEVAGREVIFHVGSRGEGRLAEAVETNYAVCLEVERPGCGWLDTVIITGRVAAIISVESGGAVLLIHAEEISGRRYFTPDG